MKTKTNPSVAYVTSLGFVGVELAGVGSKPSDQLQGFRYQSFDPAQTRHTMGKARAHVPGLLVFVLKAGRAIRVDTERQVVLLGNGNKAVQALLRTVPRKS